jgi:hypothetical protein
MRPSVGVFIAAAVLAIVALMSSLYRQKVQRDFSRKTTVTIGTVLAKGALWGKGRRTDSELFCWVSYEFAPPGGPARRNWRMWEPGCGSSPGRPVPIQYAIANPDVNRPAGSEPSFPSWLFFFAAGVAVVIGVLLRGSEKSAESDWRATLR